MNNNWDELAPAILNFEDDGNHTHAKALRQFYFGTNTVSNKTRYELVKLMTDVPWINDVRMAADLFAKHGGSVYYYFLTHEPKSGFGDVNKIGFSPPYGKLISQFYNESYATTLLIISLIYSSAYPQGLDMLMMSSSSILGRTN